MPTPSPDPMPLPFPDPRPTPMPGPGDEPIRIIDLPPDEPTPALPIPGLPLQ